MQKHHVLALAAMAAISLLSSNAPAGQLFSGVTIEQLDVRNALNGRFGSLTVDRGAIGGSSGGFINVVNSTGDWLVRNLPIDDSLTLSGNLYSTRFDLEVADGTVASANNYHIDFSPTYATSPAAFSSPSPWAISRNDFAVGGVPSGPTWAASDEVGDSPAGHLDGPSAARQNAAGIFFLPNAVGLALKQNNHPNVQAARNQCAPAAVANSLQWLEDTNPGQVNVLHGNNPGLKGDNTLVGKLDSAMNRTVTSRTNASGVWPLDGKMKYIAENDLGQKIQVKHYSNPNIPSYTGGAGLDNISLDGSKKLDRHGISSDGKGNVSWQAIFNELLDGEDVELDIVYYNAAGAIAGRHYVEVIGAGIIGGIPYIQHISDHLQTDKDANDTKGTGKIDFEWMIGDMLVQSKGRVDQIIVESPIPEPATALLPLAGTALLLRRSRRMV
jgi:hypothetical protein